MQQLALFGDQEANRPTKVDTSSCFTSNMSLPIHRWFRYSAGFSALWVRELVQQSLSSDGLRVLDPFCGSGTVLLESELCGAESMGIEAHPFVARVARAKLAWGVDPGEFAAYAWSIAERARDMHPQLARYPKLIRKCFPDPVLSRLDSLRQAWEALAGDGRLRELGWLALTSILRETSPVGTAQWQYVLPRKSKTQTADPFVAFRAKIASMVSDMREWRHFAKGPQARVWVEDARQLASVPDGWADLIITSPPYANNYDYADATRLEMSFWGEVTRWSDLQEAVRKFLVRSCTQHVAHMVSQTDDMLASPVLDPIRDEITEVCALLESARATRGGRKPYHTMIAGYFQDMANVWVQLRRVAGANASVCFVVGDSAPYGVYVPVDRWLGELAIAAGFTPYHFEKTRDRNVKWKNRKHRVPLQEGRLWAQA